MHFLGFQRSGYFKQEVWENLEGILIVSLRVIEFPRIILSKLSNLN